ncbi:zf-CCHC domain-containing protein [Tanacetum coccineum]
MDIAPEGNINDFVLYCPIAGTEALNPLKATGSFGVRNFMLCKKPRVVEEVDDESINNAFARFNTKITSLKALDESSSSRNHVRKFLRALPTKWRPKVYKLLLEKDYEASKSKKERYKSLALKANKELSDKETSTSGSEDEEYAMAVRDFKKLFRRRGRFVRQPNDDKKAFGKVKEDQKINSDRKCFKCGDLNHFISDCPKHSHSDQKEFVGGL